MGYITYIVCHNNQEFQEYLRNNPDDECIMVTDEFTLRGRQPGFIKYYGNPQLKWDYQGIVESVERQKDIWLNEFGFNQDLLDKELDQLTDVDHEDDLYAKGFME